MVRAFIAVLIGALTVVIVPAGANAANPSDQETRDVSCRNAPTGTTTINVTSQGQVYPVTAYRPAGLTKAPLVLDLHGSFSNGTEQIDRSGLPATADANKFVVAAPNGGVPTDDVGNYRWNIPGVTTVPAGSRDETLFLEDVVSTLSRSLCIDTRRIYATGYSGGGRMISYIACHTPRLFAAIAPVAGLRAGQADSLAPEFPSVTDCSPDQPVPVLAFHGLLDPTNPYVGGGAAYWQYSVPVAAQRWAQINGCQGPVTEAVNATAVRISFTKCAGHSQVVLYRLSDGGHTWPGSDGPFPAELGAINPLPASDLIWKFFSAYKL
jgi:polyhydroxybutyrate depolymerase